MNNDLALKIAGEITLSQNPGASLRKWREIFNVSQVELATFLKVTPSTISDYESNRRKSPGIAVIKRFVESICELDEKKGGWTVKKLTTEPKSDIYRVYDFPEPIATVEFCKKIEGNIVANDALIKGQKLYGYTIIDAPRAIIELP